MELGITQNTLYLVNFTISIINPKSNRSLNILPADKGNAAVIADLQTSNGKIQDVLRRRQYKKLQKDPTTSVKSKIPKPNIYMDGKIQKNRQQIRG